MQVRYEFEPTVGQRNTHPITSNPARVVAVGILSVAITACGTHTIGIDRPPEPVNVILVSLDTVSAKHVGCYGYERDTTPYLDAFAQGSVIFDHCVNTGGGTLPVHMSMLTGLFPETHNVIHRGESSVTDEFTGRLENGRTTLAEVLQEQRYTTAAFTDSGWVQGRFGFDQGFDYFDDQGGHFKQIMPKVLEWLEKHRDERFFLFVHTYDPHSKWGKLPYTAPRGYNGVFLRYYRGDFSGCIDGLCASELLLDLNKRIEFSGFDVSQLVPDEDLEYMIALYDGGIAYTDNEIGRLLNHLKRLGIYEESLIIITSDHGEEFLEHGLFLHRHTYEEIARVPLVVKFPNGEWGGTRIPHLVTTVDLMPTVLEFLGIETPPEVQGKSLMRVMRGDNGQGRVVHIWGRGSESKPKLRTDTWSLLIDEGTGEPIELYHLEDDPWERRSVIEQFPKLAERLAQRLSALQMRDRKLHLEFQRNRVEDAGS